MRRADLVDLIDRIPEADLPRLHFVMRAGLNVALDVVLRLEENYAVFRGREAGNQDEGRLFFVPFDEIVFCKLERVVKSNEVEEWFSDLPKMARKGAEVESLVETPPPEVQLDPAEIARQNLLERIRAARSVIKR